MTIQDILDLWSRDLEDHAHSFTEQAIEIKKWDSKMLKNRDKIEALQNRVEEAKAQQSSLTETLEKILTSQNELRVMLSTVEKEVSAQTPSMRSDAEHKRKNTYKLAEDIDDRLNNMGDDLEKIINTLNQSADRNLDQNNPLTRIVQILNEHMFFLQYLEESSSDLEVQLSAADQQLNQVA